MARRRYISTDISTDGKVNSLSDRAALLYTWSLPHFADDCRITPKNAAEFKMAVVPGRDWTVADIKALMEEIIQAGLWGVEESGTIFVPADSFYKYQTYVNAANRRKTPENTGERRETPENAASFPLSLTLTKKTHKNESCSASLPEEAIKLAQRLSDLIHRNFPGRTAPTEKQLMAWAYDADKTHRIDGHSWEEIEDLLVWSQQDGFWHTNILSMGKFREQWNKLLAQRSRAKNTMTSNKLRTMTEDALKRGLR